MRARIFWNVLIKLLYLGVSLIAYFCTNDVLLGNFKSYGYDWMMWSQRNHSAAFDFFVGDKPKPGNVLLPSFGFCEIQEASMDIRTVFFNKNKFICEISPNILYQYVFVVLWFVIIISIIVSIIGFIVHVAGHVLALVCFLREGKSSAWKVQKTLTLRECEYLTFIRRKNIPLYGDILRKLLQSRPGLNGLEINGNNVEGTAPMLNGTIKRSRDTEMEPYSSSSSNTHWNKR